MTDALIFKDAETLHRSLLTVDTHIDIPWPNTPDPFEPTSRCVDLPKMQRGHLSAGCFVAYCPQGPRTPDGYAAATARATAMLQTIAGMGRSANGITARVTQTVAEIRAARAEGVLGVIPAVENGHAMGLELENLTKFRAAGARYLTLTHNGHNALGDSSNPRADLGDGETLHGGLSDLGRAAIAELNRLGMLVDISHVSKATMLQAARVSKVPVVATHSCMKALCDNPRNLDDEQLDALAACGGVVQITAVSGFLRPKAKPEQVHVADYVDHIDYAVKRIGLPHVGISSDFDGGGGFVGWKDISESANMTAELVRRGYDEHAIAALWGGNFLRLLGQAEAAAAA
jgi:membrane dipeptidase